MDCYLILFLESSLIHCVPIKCQHIDLGELYALPCTTGMGVWSSQRVFRYTSKITFEILASWSDNSETTIHGQDAPQDVILLQREAILLLIVLLQQAMIGFHRGFSLDFF